MGRGMLAESMDRAMEGHRDRRIALVCVPEHIPAVVSADRLSDRYFANTIRLAKGSHALGALG